MRKIKTALVGCGKVGHLHAAALRDLPESEFVAACSRTPEKAKVFAEKYRVAPFNDVHEMIATTGAEAIFVCTQHPEHAGPTIAAAQMGVHALVEKPLASSLTDCDAMLSASRENNTLLGTVCQRRFYPPAQRIRRAIDDGKIGKPVLGTATMFGWRDETYYKSDPWRGSWKHEGGGVLVNQAPHQLDMLIWFMGEIEEVFGLWANVNHPYIEVEDTAVAVVRFKNGALGNIIVSNSQNPAINCRVSVHGANGASVGVQTDGGQMFVPGLVNISEAPYNDLWTIRGEEKFLPQWKEEDAKLFGSVNPMEYFHRLQIQDFLHAILEKRAPAVTGEDGRRTVELFTAIYRATRDKKAIQFPLKPE